MYPLLFLGKTHATAIRFKNTAHVPSLFSNVHKFYDKIALYDNAGRYSYGNIIMGATKLSRTISNLLEGRTNERILFLCNNDVNYVITLWAIWMSGQVAVPLSPLHPESILEYYTRDVQSKLLLTISQHKEVMGRVSKITNTKLHIIGDQCDDRDLVKNNRNLEELKDSISLNFRENENALILYTSGTTGHPKGVVLSHTNLSFQTNCLLRAWRWSSSDVILHTLPLHHVHGTVNALFCPLTIGATTVMLPKFSAEDVWSNLLATNKRDGDKNVSVFMAVPTIYSKLIEEYEKKFQDQKDYIKSRLENLRLMVSGSAPLPVPLYERWREISGHRLLERYGMTEIGNYDSDRKPGYVGVPLPGVSVRLSENKDGTYNTLLECKNDNGTIAFDRKTDEAVTGELLVKGDGVFKEYFNRPEATQKEFIEDSWFKTGDLCEFSPDKIKFRMLGRTSVDIIKSGGYKISALQVETKLLAHPDIKECAVVGVSDDVWGEKVAAVIVLKEGSNLSLNDLRKWAKDVMPKYSIPSVAKFVGDIPKNAMGKVNKKELVKSVFK
ncbi:hypothetical protein NQ318_019382 [Aromia moschata]|uniref:Acyl-CoA synthetase family member 3, mitochondrial n=1 Tax=Aromia moschata TaxID=1265417 RepID=A0AAV8XNZ2_9CUCU|nr:hypothetical protein NQ318_019382 [Aromia moschata]